MGLEALSHHKYQGQDDSILYHLVLNHWFNYALRFVPLWVAPNVITLAGFVVLVANLLLIMWYSPYLHGAMPLWVYVSSGVCLFFYQTMDNLDGKQARRTGTSSPLGELFDHGCDALVVTIQALVAAAIAQMGSGALSLVYMFLLMLPFWLATWETYHTGILHLRIINGPEEGIATVVLLFIATGCFGPAIWTTGYKELFHLTDIPLPDMPFKVAMLIILSIPSLLTCILNIYRVLDYAAKKGSPLWPAVKHILTFSLFFAGWLGWYLLSTNFSISLVATTFQGQSVWFTQPFATRIAVGLTFGEMVSRLILAHILKESFPLIPRALKILLVVLMYSGMDYLLRQTSASPLLPESYILVVYLMAAFISYFSFVSETIKSICSFLKISVLTIPQKSNK